MQGAKAALRRGCNCTFAAEGSSLVLKVSSSGGLHSKEEALLELFTNYTLAFWLPYVLHWHQDWGGGDTVRYGYYVYATKLLK